MSKQTHLHDALRSPSPRAPHTEFRRSTRMGWGDETNHPATPGSFLVIEHASASKVQYPLEQEPVVLGRGLGCTYVFDDERMSRSHVRLELLSDNRCAVTDLGSGNGTYINDVQVERAFMKSGDVLRIGDTVFRLTIAIPLLNKGVKRKK